MRTIERMDFRNIFGVAPTCISKAKPGDVADVNGRKLEIIERKYVREKTDIIRFSCEGEEYCLDLAPHWERGGDGPVHCCHEGVINLIRGVYQQTANDLEALYTCGLKDYPCTREFMENKEEYEQRKAALYFRAVKNAEDFLGSVLTGYVKVKAYYKMGKSIDEIAKILEWTPEHTANVIDRLGLNRTETAQNDEFFI